jgi:membrane fusion protein, multidrug efflux system
MRSVALSAKLVMLFAAAVCLMSSCHMGGDNKKKDDKKKKPQLSLAGYVIKPVLLDQSISVSGTLKPFEETALVPEIAGRVVTLNLPEGKAVAQGTLLVQLFNDDLQATLSKLQAQLAILEQTYKRQTELLKVNGISQTDYDQLGLQIHSSKADIEVQKALIRKTKILAPYNGVIGLRNVSLGAEVNTTTVLATIREVDRLKLDFSVPEKYSSQIKPGLKVKFNIQGTDKVYEATVAAIEHGIDPGTRNLKVRALVVNNTSVLMPGAYASVNLVLGENKSAMMVPTESVIPNEHDKSIIVVKGGKAKFVKVTTGIREASTIEVVSGLSIGDTILTNGIMFVKPNMDVKLTTVK